MTIHPIDRTDPDKVADDIYDVLRCQFADDDIFSAPNTPTIWVRRWNRWYRLDLVGPLAVGFCPWRPYVGGPGGGEGA